MNYKHLLLIMSLIMVTPIFAQNTTTPTLKFYGYVGNEFFYNSRQNQDLVDGVIMLFPKPVALNSVGVDVNASPQAEMLSVNSRLGVDISGASVFGAKSTGKIEADFAGFGTTFYVLRIRQAYAKLNWDKTELLLGQTWHPLFGTVAPSTPSSNGGAPFQPFNRSPQLRFKYNLSKTFAFTGAALYEMQYASQGALGTSNVYLKNAILPNLFVGFENKSTHWITGIGGDIKTLKLTTGKITSTSGVAYAQYNNKLLTIKGKVIYGQNLSNQLMIGGYGVSNINSATNDTTYTNFNTATGWFNVVYGSKLQVGFLAGLSRNLGTSDQLALNSNGKFIAYGYGFTSKSQLLMNQLYRLAPSLTYSISNFKFSLEYDYTTANYGTIQDKGTVINAYNVANNRILASVSYNF